MIAVGRYDAVEGRACTVREVLRDLQIVEEVVFLIGHPRKTGVQWLEQASAHAEDKANSNDGRDPSIQSAQPA